MVNLGEATTYNVETLEGQVENCFLKIVIIFNVLFLYIYKKQSVMRDLQVFVLQI